MTGYATCMQESTMSIRASMMRMSLPRSDVITKYTTCHGILPWERFVKFGAIKTISSFYAALYASSDKTWSRNFGRKCRKRMVGGALGCVSKVYEFSYDLSWKTICRIRYSRMVSDFHAKLYACLDVTCRRTFGRKCCKRMVGGALGYVSEVYEFSYFVSLKTFARIWHN